MPLRQRACDYTPKANAMASNLRFQKIDLKALPDAGGRDRGLAGTATASPR